MMEIKTDIPKIKTIPTSVILQKREKGEKTDTAHLIIYDPESFGRLQDIARKNNTNTSSIISNFIDYFTSQYADKPPTLDTFTDPNHTTTPSILDSEEKIIKYIKTLDEKTLLALDSIFYHAHVYSRVLSENPNKRDMLSNMEYGPMWHAWYR
jgi:hypothetical protein